MSAAPAEKKPAFPFWRCPLCGHWVKPSDIQKAAGEGHKLEMGKPAGRGKPWLYAPMAKAARAVLVQLLRNTADKLETSK